MSTWISVKERLPEQCKGKPFSKDVLLWCGTYAAVGAKSFAKAGSDWWDQSGNDPIVTHWMPLPEPPKEKAHKPKERSMVYDVRDANTSEITEIQFSEYGYIDNPEEVERQWKPKEGIRIVEPNHDEEVTIHITDLPMLIKALKKAQELWGENGIRCER